LERGQSLLHGADYQVSNEFIDEMFNFKLFRNACGTMALVHAIGNNVDQIKFTAASKLKAFLDETVALKPMERSKILESSQELSSAHESCSMEGQTSAPNVADSVDYHFVAFVRGSDRLYELDGRREGPICHGNTSKETFLEDAGRVCRSFMKRNPENLNFTAVALVKDDTC